MFWPDPFGNLSKTGTITFQPTYNPATNRVSSQGNYDMNGNLTSDGLHSYSWDADGNTINIGGVSVTYDALDRMVEQSNGQSYTQVVYGPAGGKLALMSGQTLAKGFVPLSGGATAVYHSSGLAYYRHADWLGSSRLASTPTRTVYSDGAYAPYGENYAEMGTPDSSFTGQNQDTISTGSYPLYDFLAREYHPVWSRWLSPDPAGLGAADPANPQTWNRYAYVSNNPLVLTDPDGLMWQIDCSNTFARMSHPPGCPSFWSYGTEFDWMTLTVLREGVWEHLWTGMLLGTFDPGFNHGDIAELPLQKRAPGWFEPLVPPIACTDVPKSPPGVSATANVNMVQQATRGMMPATKLSYFYYSFRTGGPFDYKATGGDQYVDYGNWNFGYVCAANYPAFFCQSAAGTNRMWRAATQGYNPFGSGVPFIKRPYGDQAADNQQIRNGIQAYRSGCVQ